MGKVKTTRKTFNEITLQKIRVTRGQSHSPRKGSRQGSDERRKYGEVDRGLRSWTRHSNESLFCLRQSSLKDAGGTRWPSWKVVDMDGETVRKGRAPTS